MSSLTALTASDAERIAIALSDVLQEADLRAGRPPRSRLKSDWVEITKLPEAGTYSVTVVDRDVMAQVRPYIDPPGFGSFRDPMLAGYRLDGTPHPLRLDQHGQFIGQSTSGKSSLIQSAIAHATRSRRGLPAVVWIGGVQKLYDLVGPWIEPYCDTGFRSPIDWIAYGHQHTLMMMAAAMRIGRHRQNLRMHERGNWPAIFLILDECSFLLEAHGEWIEFDGQKMFADALAADILRGATSGDVYACLAMQHDVHAVLGDKGGTLQAQMRYTGVFKIRDEGTLGRQLGDYKLPMPRFQGEYWLDDGENLPFRLKAPYIQTPDKGKQLLLPQGPFLDALAWSRRVDEQQRITLDPVSTRIAGEAYRNRHTMVDDAFVSYVRGIDASFIPEFVQPIPSQRTPRYGDPEQREVDEAQEELLRAVKELVAAGENVPQEMLDMLAAAGLIEEPDATCLAKPDLAAPMPTALVPSLLGRRARHDRVLEIVRASPEPLTRGQIADQLKEQGDHFTDPQVVSNALTKLIREGRLTKPTEQTYVAQ